MGRHAARFGLVVVFGLLASACGLTPAGDDLQGSEGGEQAAKERQAALDYGRAVIQKAKGPGDLVVFFDAEDDVPYPNVIQVMNMAKSAGVTTLGIVTVDLDTADEEGAAPAAPAP